MIRVHRMFRIADRALRHVASCAVVGHRSPFLLILAARIGPVTFQATLAEERRPRCLVWFDVRVVARSAPEAVSTGTLTGALLQLLEMAIDAQRGRLVAGPDEERGILRQQISWLVSFPSGTDAGDSRCPGEMALRANAVSAPWLEL